MPQNEQKQQINKNVMENVKFYLVCASVHYKEIFEVKELSRAIIKKNLTNDRIEQKTGERPWDICTSECPTNYANGLTFIPCGYHGNPEIRDTRTQVCLYELK